MASMAEHFRAGAGWGSNACTQQLAHVRKLLPVLIRPPFIAAAAEMTSAGRRSTAPDGELVAPSGRLSSGDDPEITRPSAEFNAGEGRGNSLGEGRGNSLDSLSSSASHMSSQPSTRSSFAQEGGVGGLGARPGSLDRPGAGRASSGSRANSIGGPPLAPHLLMEGARVRGVRDGGGFAGV